jgi:hypothetical protein
VTRSKDRQIQRQKDIETDRHRERQAWKRTDIETDRYGDRQTETNLQVQRLIFQHPCDLAGIRCAIKRCDSPAPEKKNHQSVGERKIATVAQRNGRLTQVIQRLQTCLVLQQLHLLREPVCVEY